MKAKTVIFGALFSLFCYNLTNAQVEFGAKAGVQFNDMSLNGIGLLEQVIPEPQMTPGLTASVYATIPVSRNIAFESGINYARKGFRVQESVNANVFGLDLPIGATAITRLDYLELPLMMKVQTSTGAANLYVKGGPYVAYAVHGDIKARINSFVDFDLGTFPFNVNGALYNPWEFGVKGTAGVEVTTSPRGAFFAEATYTQGLTDVLDEPVLDIRMKNMGVGLALGYVVRF